MLATKTWRKREAVEQKYKREESSQLNQIRDLFQAGQTPEALQRIDQKLATETRPLVQAQFLSMAADSQMRLGKFTDAIDIYRKAAQLNADHFCQWIRPRYGLVQALLKDVRVNEAVAEAQAIWDKAVDLDLKYEQQLAQARATLQSQGQIVILPRPPRRSVVASQLGQMFLSEGEIQAATDFYQKAIENNPGGGCRARQGLAVIALREGNLSIAEQWATEALVGGKYQAKTISAWKLLIEARQRQSKKGVPAEHLEALTKLKKATVRSRSILALAKALRIYSDSAWQIIAQKWLQEEGEQHPIIAVEIKKLFLAAAKIQSGNSNAQTRYDAAAELLNTQNLSPSEYLSATKERVKSLLLLGQTVQFENFVEEGISKFSEKFGWRLRHGLALACMGSQRDDLARSLLQTNMASISPTEKAWAKSVWALAKLENDQKNYGLAANHYLRFTQQETIDLRFRLQSRIEWVKCLVQSGDVSQILTAKDQLLSAISNVTDFDTVLNFARHLLEAPEELKGLANEIFNRGEALALTAFEQESNPTSAAQILCKLSRRYFDMRRYSSIVESWLRLNQKKQDWLWSENTAFWEYLSLVIAALWNTKNRSNAEFLVKYYLEDSTTPPIGVVHIGINHAIKLFIVRETDKALHLFNHIINVAPSASESAIAYYYLGVAALKRQEIAKSKDLGEKARRTASNTSQLFWMKEMRMRGLLLEYNLNAHAAVKSQNEFLLDDLQRELQTINRDLKRV